MREYKLNLFYLLFITFISIAFYNELIFFGNTYYFRDLATILLPLQKTVLTLLEDSFPLWNPYQVLGKPLFADPLSGLQYPPNLIFYLFEQPYTYNLSIVFHHIAAAFGFYLLLRSIKFGFQSSAIAGVLFSFSGVMVSQDNMINALQSSTWAPYVLCYFILVIRESKKSDFFKLVIFNALCFLGGMPEICIYLNFFFVLLAFYYKGEGVDLKNSLFLLFKVNLFLIGLTAFFLVPFLEYVNNSTRVAGLKESLIVNFSHNPINTLGFFIPRFLVDENGLFKEKASLIYGNYKSLPWAISIYIGISSLFILPSIYFAKIKNTVFFILIFTIFLMLSFGGYIPYYGEVVSNFPILNLSRYPEKYLYCVSGILVVGVAFGLESILKNRKKANLFYIFILVIILLDLYFVNLNQLPTISYKDFIAKPLTLSSIKNERKLTRIYNNELRDVKDLRSDIDLLKVKKSLLMHGIANQYGLSNLNTPASLNLRYHEKIISKIGKLTKDEIISLLQALSVNYVTSQNPLIGYKDLKQILYDKEQRVFVYKLSNSKPLAYIKGQEFKVTITNYTANKIDLTVKLDRPQTLILNDTYYPGWSVLVNDKKSKIYNYNGVRSIKINKGKNKITFSFLPLSLLFGAIISGLTLIYLCISTLKSK